MHAEHPPARRVVAVQLERLGDLLVSTPALRGLRRSLPHARITLICAPATASILRGWDAIDDIAEFDQRWPVAAQRSFISGIRASGVDLSVTLTSSRPAYAMARRLGGPRRGGVVYAANLLESALAGLFFTHPVRIWVAARPAPDARVLHRAEELLRVNAALGLEATPVPLELPIGASHHARASAWLAAAGAADRPPVVLHLARGSDDGRGHGQWLGEGWTGDDLLRLIDRLRELAAPAPLVLTAGPEDAASVAVVERAHRFSPAEVAADVGGAADAPGATGPRMAEGGRLVLVSGADIGTWASVVARAAVVVTPDTGAVHVAAAVGRPVVAVYAPTRFEVTSRQWAPFMVPHRAVVKSEPAATIARIVDGAAALKTGIGPARAAGGAA